MSETVECPTCGARCRIERDAATGAPRLVHLQDRQLTRKIDQLKGALLRVRAAVKADAKTRARGGED